MSLYGGRMSIYRYPFKVLGSICLPMDTPHLDWALATNQHCLRVQLLDAYQGNTSYLPYLDDLIRFLREHQCGHIRDKLDDVSEPRKLRSTVSELEVAKALIQRGKSVSLLPDQYLGVTGLPDMVATDSYGEVLIEVKLLTDDGTSEMLVEGLRRFIRDQKQPYVVNVTLNERMSIPAINNPKEKRYERQTKTECLKQGLQEFKERVVRIDLASLPVRIDTGIGVFEVYQSKSGRGYPGIVETSPIEVPDDKVVEKIRQDLVEKARKRERWAGDWRRKPFIVALDSRDWDCDEDHLNSALIGETITVITRYTSETEDIKVAIRKCWESYMREKYILPHEYTYLNPERKGILFTKRVMKNVSAVLGITRGCMWFVANPFAFDEINDCALSRYL